MTRHSVLMVVLASTLCLAPLACGGSEPPAETETAAGGEAAPAPAAAELDPCLVPLETWESATGSSGLALDRSSRDTCDVLDDANLRVTGSISLLSMSIYEGTPNVFDTEEIEGLGDGAYWVAAPGSVYVRSGERAFSLMVHPAVEDRREVAIELARTALDSL